MSWFVALVQDPNSSHANPYACSGFQHFKQLLTAGFQFFTRKSLRLYKLPKIQTTPYTGARSQCLPCKSLCCAGSQKFKSFLMQVLASNNSHANPDACAGSRQFKQFLMPGQASNNSHANPYACAGSDNAKNSLRLCRLPTINMQILTFLKVPDN
ncbi:hypothetical protein O181_056023 [Austropuccinia psidii MF-1]|uniref:Uncharacterized protein n=1 Tax=Austropuccinia psidii MF-1 TaxID=1389203 RepID=A0A9Q3HT18_9BASI|nr:hypothetical protein [Austropuccinia psidii MF-1]